MNLFRTPLTALAIFALNLALAWRFFRAEYTVYLSSIEGAYIGLARYIQAHWGDLGWLPLWYGGIPFHDSYPPALHHLVAAVGAVTGWSAGRAYHATCAVTYAFGAVTLYWLVRALAKSEAAGAVAALFFSVVSPSAWLISGIGRDMGSPTYARRLMTLVQFGEGPHLLSLTLVPVALLTMHRLLEQPSAWRLALTAVAYAAVALSNWLGSFTLALGTFVILAIHPWRRSVPYGAAAGTLAYALASPWIPPSTIRLVRQNAQIVGGDYQLTGMGMLVFAGILAVAGVAVWLWRERHPALAAAAAFTILTGGITLTKEWAHLTTWPQPERYHLAMEMGLAMLAGVAWSWVWTRSPRTGRRALVVASAGLLLFQAREYRQYARMLIKTTPIQETLEYRVSEWVAANLPGERVFLSGSSGFWSTAFADVVQFKGGFDQGQPYRNRHDANYALPYLEHNGAVTAAWLRAYGNRAVLVSGRQTRDAYQDWRDPRKFDGVLPLRWEQGDDRIYEVPAGQKSLAHVIRLDEAVPVGPLDWQSTKQIDAYVRAIDDGARAPAAFAWRGQSRAEITATVAPGEVIAVQINHHPGWQAEAAGRALETSADGLGFLLIQPRAAGPVRISLWFDGGTEAAAMRALQTFAVLVLAGWAIREQIVRRRALSR